LSLALSHRCRPSSSSRRGVLAHTARKGSVRNYRRELNRSTSWVLAIGLEFDRSGETQESSLLDSHGHIHPGDPRSRRLDRTRRPLCTDFGGAFAHSSGIGHRRADAAFNHRRLSSAATSCCGGVGARGRARQPELGAGNAFACRGLAGRNLAPCPSIDRRRPSHHNQCP
jgi:hypothetical protein